MNSGEHSVRSYVRRLPPILAATAFCDQKSIREEKIVPSPRTRNHPETSLPNFGRSTGIRCCINGHRAGRRRDRTAENDATRDQS